MDKQVATSEFEVDVKAGLSKVPKQLSSKYFYDKKGDQLFQEIMKLEEYYLPACEAEILRTQTFSIADRIPDQQVDVLELGAGDGSKTVIFLENLIKSDKKIKYIPMDISSNILEINKENIHKTIPDLDIEPVTGDYFHTMQILKDQMNTKLVLFLGSNIGNYRGEAAVRFLQMVHGFLHQGDYLLMGVDLKKNPKTILAAYNDKKGVTKNFNLNLLERINRELGADFNVTAFDHYPCYDPVAGIAFSYLVSLEAQKVTFEDGTEFGFKINELIHTEVSQKYSLEELSILGSKIGFSEVRHFTDEKGYFSTSLFKK